MVPTRSGSTKTNDGSTDAMAEPIDAKHDSTLDEILDRLKNDGWTCGWHIVHSEDGSQQVVIEGRRKNVTLVWRWSLSEPSKSNATQIQMSENRSGSGP
jgi:hypothetical protein